MKTRIVAEISKSWKVYRNTGEVERNELLLCQLFEQVIEVNAGRGYVLESWNISQVMTPSELVETIIAVFKLKNA